MERRPKPALDLTVHPSTAHIHRPGMGILILCPGCIADREVRLKRFTAAELSAELYRSVAWLAAKGRAHTADAGRNIVGEAAFTFGPITRDEHEFEVMHRFTHLPNHDEGRP